MRWRTYTLQTHATAQGIVQCAATSAALALDIQKAAMIGPAQGSVMASDAFFPFAWNDSVELACQAGVTAIAHPGGSMRDADAVECCNKYGVALVTTGIRHFRH